MAAWRRKALEIFPELASKIDEDAFSPYALFFMLLPFSEQAHRRGDNDSLRRVYGYAQWCHHQRHGSDLPHAVGVAFSEHLFDWGLREQIAPEAPAYAACAPGVRWLPAGGRGARFTSMAQET